MMKHLVRYIERGITMKRYETYKKVDLPWLEEVPEHWDVTKYKRYFISGMGNTILKEDLSDVGIPVFSATEKNVVFGYVKNPKLVLNRALRGYVWVAHKGFARHYKQNSTFIHD